MSINEAINGLAYAFGRLIAGEHSLSGRWSVEVIHCGVVHRKHCSNYATARAWALYLLRRWPGLDVSSVSIVQEDPAPGFPIQLIPAGGEQ